MAAFHYVAIDANAKKKSGIIEAENAKQARQLLRQKNLIPLEMDFAQQKKSRHRSRLTIKELSLITRQCAALLAAGIPLEEVLSTVAEQIEKTSTKGLVLAIRSKILEGHALANALNHFPDAFSELYCSTVAAGEKSGHLDLVLQRLADYTEQQFHTRQKIQQALIYPALMICVSIGIVGFLLEYVVPKMINVYTGLNQTLPLATQILISGSAILKNDGIYIVLTLVVLILLFRYRLKTRLLFRERMHRFALRIPFFGNAIKTINTARFSKTFAILSSAGISVIEAMRISAKLITNLPMRHAVEEAAARVQEGAAIHLALKQTGYFPPMSIHLIASGEASGQLENMLERAAKTQDSEITRLIETSLALFEPIIILFMGAIVLFIVLAVLLPIFQLNQLTV